MSSSSSSGEADEGAAAIATHGLDVAEPTDLAVSMAECAVLEMLPLWSAGAKEAMQRRARDLLVGGRRDAPMERRLSLWRLEAACATENGTRVDAWYGQYHAFYTTDCMPELLPAEVRREFADVPILSLNTEQCVYLMTSLVSSILLDTQRTAPFTGALLDQVMLVIEMVNFRAQMLATQKLPAAYFVKDARAGEMFMPSTALAAVVEEPDEHKMARAAPRWILDVSVLAQCLLQIPAPWTGAAPLEYTPPPPVLKRMFGRVKTVSLTFMRKRFQEFLADMVHTRELRDLYVVRSRTTTAADAVHDAMRDAMKCDANFAVDVADRDFTQCEGRAYFPDFCLDYLCVMRQGGSLVRHPAIRPNLRFRHLSRLWIYRPRAPGSVIACASLLGIFTELKRRGELNDDIVFRDAGGEVRGGWRIDRRFFDILDPHERDDDEDR